MKEEKLIYSWEKDPTHQLRITFTKYKGTDVFHVREYFLYPETRDDWRPTRTGICLSIRHLPKLHEGIKLAHEQCQKSKAKDKD